MKITPAQAPMLARAYGPPPTRPASNPIDSRAARVADSASVSSLRSPETAARLSTASRAANLAKLIAGTTPGRVSFEGDSASLSAPGAYTMHGRPADRNAAAVGVQVGRSLDISG